MDIAYIMSLAVLLSIVMALLGVILIIIDAMREQKREENKEEEKKEKEGKKTSVGGVVLIGPIPIVFGNDSSVIKWAMVLTIIVVVLFILLTLL
ncbi:TIGR00304 family membrane protein [Vulcanisaeta souniana]|uniref:TIGR00304 family protein n=1 Tax=Vulcanisaeta souniana JCM 11219 TaxID=1293586 RepID=A0A830E960_9CREN|nr:DUF131 domain-containing protein [Vulcanisaeta souniana]BDR92990.1 hypothetical protein Vsou_20830 [Vulcanisaeta souniana JCM 11219]GGI83766.1 hypothetical protein GCM10007112_20680 [Vulcanisaeta souniana JCM 11219]